MFELARLIGRPRSSISLQTKNGIDIENEQAPEPDLGSVNSYIPFRNNSWTPRKPACGTYNCYGHVWASRRTSIYKDTEIPKILENDEYKLLSEDDSPVPGDIVIYRDSKNNIIHAAIITRLEKLDGTENIIPFALSKWSDAFGEDIHSVYELPNSEFYKNTILQYWTDRDI